MALKKLFVVIVVFVVVDDFVVVVDATRCRVRESVYALHEQQKSSQHKTITQCSTRRRPS